MKRLALAAVAVALVVGPVLALTGCPQVAKDVTDGVKTEACIVAQVNAAPAGAIPYEQIAIACGGIAIQDVIDIVATVEAALAKTAGDAGMAASAPSELQKKLSAVKHK